MKNPNKIQPSQNVTKWSPENKLDAVIKTGAMSANEIGEFLRANGLHSNDLTLFREEILTGFRKVKKVKVVLRLIQRLKSLGYLRKIWRGALSVLRAPCRAKCTDHSSKKKPRNLGGTRGRRVEIEVKSLVLKLILEASNSGLSPKGCLL